MTENKKPVNFYKKLSETTEKAVREINKRTKTPSKELILSTCNKYGLNYNKMVKILDKKY